MVFLVHGGEEDVDPLAIFDLGEPVRQDVGNPAIQVLGQSHVIQTSLARRVGLGHCLSSPGHWWDTCWLKQHKLSQEKVQYIEISTGSAYPSDCFG